LQKFIIFGRAQLDAVRTLIRAIDNLPLAKEVREQKKAEAQLLAGALLDAEARLGELLKETDRRYVGVLEGTNVPKQERTLPDGINKKQSYQFQRLADNLDVIEQVKADAIEDEDLPTRTEVLRRVKEREATEHHRIPGAFKIPSGVLVSDELRPFLELIVSNVWHLNEKGRISGYGSAEFRGNTPPEVLVQCLLRYTSEGDTVLDCMAGSGTTIDICKALKRKVIATDIKAWREDISVADAEALPLDRAIDFVFIHVPYLDMYQYTEEANDLSRMSLEEFEAKIDRILKQIVPSLNPERFLAILVGDIRKSGLIDLSSRVSLIGARHLDLWDKAIIETRNIGAHAVSAHGNIGLTMDRARRLNFLVQAHDTLLIFRRRSQ
jgi:hypothetical protein